MATAIEARTDGWHALAVDWPEACRVHHCWVDECPDGSHDTGDDREGEA